ncbi:MAG: hypothetical protein ACREAW_00380, partial [Nitrososphaera sp.]
LILLVEKVAQLPVGTFYLVLASALLQTQEHTLGVVALGFLTHLAAGSVMGLAIFAPFSISPKSFAGAIGRYAPAYGLAAGFALWVAIFLPVTFGMMLPLLNSIDGPAVIRQQVPSGEVSSIATGELLALMDKVIIGSLAFNIFYGLLAVLLARSLSEGYLRRNQVIL